LSKKILVAVALVAILIGSGAYALAVTGKQNTAPAPEKIVISQGPAASIDYTIYDMFEEPWQEWWADRLTYYGTDFILTSGAGWNTALFLPSRSVALSYQGIIYAPYRYAIEAVDLTTMSMNDPEFMPVLGPTAVPTASASVDIYFQYLYETWWNDYWIANWGGDPDWVGDAFYSAGATDGYYLGTTYSIEMNREAAYSWLNLPTGDDVATWWAANKESTEDAWDAWILNEGNVRLDIYCGYEWSYDAFGTYMDLVELGPDSVVLQLDHISWGYEILMTRWLTETQVSPGLEPWYEDFSMQVSYGETTADLVSDAVAQYSMHANKANQTADGAAWVWEPAKVDYIYKVGHPSNYTPYRTLKYQSWNAGDVFFGTEVPYEQTPNEFDLAEGQTLTIQLPTVNCPAYQGVGLTEADYDLLGAGDNTSFLDIMDNGQLGLGYWVTGWPSGLDLTNMYNPTTRTLTVQGPQDFENNVRSPTTMYHGAPWVEFWVDHTAPVADAGTDIGGVVTQTPVTFFGENSTDDVRVYNYTWSFMHDGSPVTLWGPNPDFSFMTLGDYTVTLTVMDSIGNTDTDAMIVHVTIIIPEFPMVLIPLAATMALIVVFKKRKQ